MTKRKLPGLAASPVVVDNKPATRKKLDPEKEIREPADPDSDKKEGASGRKKTERKDRSPGRVRKERFRS